MKAQTIKLPVIWLMTVLCIVSCVEKESTTKYVPIKSINFSENVINMIPGEKLELSVNVVPENYTDTLLFSSDNYCVSVDANGVLTANMSGKAVVKVMSGDYYVTAQCTVNVTDDYVDEYGINHGPGVEVYGVVWAPVNCGYHKDDYPWGKLYQWGRSDGHGYSDSKGTFDDPILPIIELSPLIFGDTPEPEVFYCSTPDWEYSYFEWIEPDENGDPAIDGTVAWGNLPLTERFAGMEGIGDPCPMGWRLPTLGEIETLKGNTRTWGIEGDWTIAETNTPMGQRGVWFGPNHATATADNPAGCVFFPKAGERDPRMGVALQRNGSGSYWTATPRVSDSYYGEMLYIDHRVMQYAMALGQGYSVRCVKE